MISANGDFIAAGSLLIAAMFILYRRRRNNIRPAEELVSVNRSELPFQF